MTEEKMEKMTLREWRKYLGLSQVDVARLAECSNSTVGLVERGAISFKTDAGRRILDALSVTADAVLQENQLEGCVGSPLWDIDGFAPEAPRRGLKWWREARVLSLENLGLLAQIDGAHIFRIEHGKTGAVRPLTRHKLAKALRVAPDKLVFHGDRPIETSTVRVEDLLREELRGARRALKKARDFMRNDAAITFRYQDARDAILPDIEREVRGL